MRKNFSIVGFFLLLNIIILLIVVPSIKKTSYFQAYTQGYPPPNSIVIPVSDMPNEPTKTSLQLRTFPFITITTAPTVVPTPGTGYVPPNPPSVPTTPGSPIPVTTPIIGGPASPSDPFYCIDDEDPDMCDDNSSHHVPKGTGGVSGSCGTVIEQAHKLVNALPQYMKGLRDHLTSAVTNCGYTTGPVGGYLSTHFVIDAYNLAGLTALSKTNPNHVSPSGLLSWWQAQQPGYVFLPYSPTVVQDFGSGKRDLTGCVMFLSTGSSYHIGIVNKLELFTPGGDGVISILQAGTRMYIDRFPVSGWNISNTSTNQTNTNGVTGFGCSQ